MRRCEGSNLSEVNVFNVFFSSKTMKLNVMNEAMYTGLLSALTTC